ncbi:Glucosamine-6-phosphate isomerases/6-phosphogluconolactonase [compost metagenome]
MLYRPLIGESREETTRQLAVWLQQELTKSDYAIGLFGIGSDGHTAGIKPDSIAVESSDWAAGYAGNDFERITMTFAPIHQLNEVVIQASGQDKQTILKELQEKDIPLNIQPAQILKTVPVATIYSDNKIE